MPIGYWATLISNLIMLRTIYLRVGRLMARPPKTVRGLTLFYGRGDRQYADLGISAMFRRVCKQAGVEDFHIHDIRAKSLTDASLQGLDVQ